MCVVQGTTEEAAKDIAAFVAIFFENFSKFKGRAFHMAGESYGVGPINMIPLIPFFTKFPPHRAGTSPSSLQRFTTKIPGLSMKD